VHVDLDVQEFAQRRPVAHLGVFGREHLVIILGVEPVVLSDEGYSARPRALYW
jgi:hypothetical protein